VKNHPDSRNIGVEEGKGSEKNKKKVFYIGKVVEPRAPWGGKQGNPRKEVRGPLRCWRMKEKKKRLLQSG